MRKRCWEATIRILVIENNAAMADCIRGVLVDAAFVVDIVRDGEKGCALGESHSFDAAILELSLPRLPGLEVLKKWRASSQDFPVLVLTGLIGWRYRVNALNAGADDYMEKPFQPEELIARVRSLVRRSHGKSHPILSHMGIEVDSTSGLVRKCGADVELTTLELRILSYLMYRPERIVSQNELMDHVYSIETVRDSNTIEVYIARLRKKLGRETIRTVRGMGYRMGN
ncbi:response regulator transcription factor [Methylocystis sp. MJC1]|uniref:response regulator transcription factor n=2 Tax=Methylocystis sp. MJC1 TaxID=2654282 RepID=UPI002110C4F9|nr:response regulator transcription factor [Methylocystis sp. MJC1]